MNIGAILKSYREHKGYTHKQLGEKAGVAQSTISEIENNKKSPTVETLRKILNALDLTLSEFFNPSTFDLPSDLIQLLEISKQLPKEERKALIQYLLVRLTQSK